MTVANLESLALHRLALAPFRADADADAVRQSMGRGLKAGEDRFLEFLGENGLDALWYEVLKRHDLAAATPERVLTALKQARQVAAVRYLAQRHALERIDAAFGAASVRYAAFKGAHVRELVYDDPSLRPAGDVDILIARNQRDLAARTLVRQGFALHPDADVVSHEAAFHDRNVSVDLHWQILRPGRTRVDMTDAFLARRRRQGFFWGLDPADALFILLVHPAFAKYVTSPYALLCRVVDLSRWLRTGEMDWDKTLALLGQAGLKTAAWVVLRWASWLMGPVAPPDVLERLEPGRWRARYLGYWLEQNLPSRWLRYPLLVQIAFTLALHDCPNDAMTAIQGWLRHKWKMRDEQETLLAALSDAPPGRG
ncbi:MAG: nucleotidyltransferase family protein [Candidatus Contendobacter sp.]|nr:nucleotidyltransferase family protein [Candidatus Contendobacter sp.]MDG4556935.1 nucleotidyltransferase family protein [Candidatus Contendobacter sp.]